MGVKVRREAVRDGGLDDETHLIAALRAGEESAFVLLIDRYHAGMVRIAQMFVRDAAVAEEVVQEAWLGVLRGLARFEARSSLKQWISTILINRAKTRATRERRSIPFSALWDESGAEFFEASIEPERFRPEDSAWPGGWVSFPHGWNAAPDERFLSQEAQTEIRACIDALPGGQRQVVVLRDVHGMSAQETCNLLQISEVNQRVLLHRGRSKVRRAIELYLAGT
jgi:RNA polymerase sigma-70 factor, ECF subfamily